MCAGTPLLSTFLGLLLDSLASVQPGSPATGHVGMWFDSGTGGPDWPLAMPMGIDSSASYSQANFFAAFLPWVASTGATSASMFDPEVLSPCAAVYPDNPNNPSANNTVLQNAATNFLNHSYSAAFYRLGSIIANWSRNSLSGGVLRRGSIQ
jgi:hypothetical protein